MARTCTVCTHPKRDEIDAALVAQEPIRDIAGRTGTTKSALDRHRQHVASGLVKAKEAKEAARADSLLDAVRGLAEDAHRIRRKAEKAEDLRTALDAIGKLTKIVELLVKLRSEGKEPEEPLRFVVTMADGRMASTPAAEIPVTAYVVSPPVRPPAPAREAPAVAPEVLASRERRPRPARTREEDAPPPPPHPPAAPRLRSGPRWKSEIPREGITF